MVESQHRVSTLKLVDNLEEQAVLEDLIESAKPPRPQGPEFARLHYLLATPFRYPPLRHGSRFGTAIVRGIWYGSRSPHTVMAEVAHYRFLFLDGSAADLRQLVTEHSLFHVPLATEKGIDLTTLPFSEYEARFKSKTDYRSTQALGQAMREAGVEAFLFRSARDPEGGSNVGVFSPRAFARKTPLPSTPQTWRCLANDHEVVFSRINSMSAQSMAFGREVSA